MQLEKLQAESAREPRQPKVRFNVFKVTH